MDDCSLESAIDFPRGKIWKPEFVGLPIYLTDFDIGRAIDSATNVHELAITSSLDPLKPIPVRAMASGRVEYYAFDPVLPSRGTIRLGHGDLHTLASYYLGVRHTRDLPHFIHKGDIIGYVCDQTATFELHNGMSSHIKRAPIVDYLRSIVRRMEK